MLSKECKKYLLQILKAMELTDGSLTLVVADSDKYIIRQFIGEVLRS